MLGKNRLKQFREEKGLSLRELGKLSGLDHSTISAIELCKQSPTLETMIQIALALEINMWDIFYYECEKDDIQKVDTPHSES